MDNQPATNSSRNLLVRIWPWLVVLAMLLFVGFVRVRLLNMPLERDEGEYAYAGQLILQGVPPYELAYNLKLPGTYYGYAVGMAVFGQTPAGIHLTLLVVNALTTIFVFLLGRKLFGAAAGVMACASYGLLSLNTAVLGLAAHATQFVVLFAVPATLLLWQSFQSGNRRTIFFSGLLYGLAFVMKQQGAAFGLFGLAVLFWRERREPAGVADSAKRISLFILGGALPFLVVCLYLAGVGVFHQFWFWTFSYARTYVTDTPLVEGVGYLLDYIRNQFDFYVGFWILAGAGLMVALRNTTDQTRLTFVMSFLFFSFLGVMPGLYFRAHYFVLLLPAFALTVGMAVQLLQSTRLRWLKALPVIMLAGVMAWNVWLQWGAFFQFPPQIVCQLVYMNNPFVESVTVAKYIREHSIKDARVAVIGSEPESYFYAQRRSATGYIYTYSLMENQPYASMMQQQMIKEIESVKPEFIVVVVNKFSWLAKETSDTRIFGWAQKYTAEHYDRIGLVDYRRGKPSIELWGDEAKNYSGNPGQFLDVYQRKPQSN